MPKRKVAEAADAAAAAAAAADAEPRPSAIDDEQAEVGSSDSGSSDSSSSSSGSGSSGSDDDSSAPEVSDADPDEPDGGGDAFDSINVDFQFFDPAESDFHGLKALLHAFLDGQQYASSGLADAIIAQRSVGTVVRTGEDEDPIGLMTVLNTQQHRGAEWMAQVRQYALTKCQDAALRAKLAQAWDAPGTGLLLNERLINSPPQLAPPLVQALFDEVGWATEDEPTQELRDAFKFRQYVVMTRVFSDPAPGQQEQQQREQQQQQQPQRRRDGSGAEPSAGRPPAGPKPKQAKKQKGDQHPQQQQQQAPVIVYVRPEDEFFHAAASASFTFPVEGRPVAKGELQPLRLVMLLPASKVPAARAALEAVIGNMAAAQQ